MLLKVMARMPNERERHAKAWRIECERCQ